MSAILGKEHDGLPRRRRSLVQPEPRWWEIWQTFKRAPVVPLQEAKLLASEAAHATHTAFRSSVLLEQDEMSDANSSTPDLEETTSLRTPDPLKGIDGKVDVLLASADGGRVAAASSGEIVIWATRQGNAVPGERVCLKSDAVRSMCFCRHGKHLACVLANGAGISMWLEKSDVRDDSLGSEPTMEWVFLYNLKVDAVPVSAAIVAEKELTLRRLFVAVTGASERGGSSSSSSALPEGHCELQFWSIEEGREERGAKVATTGKFGEVSFKAMGLSPDNCWMAVALSRMEGMQERGSLCMQNLQAEEDEIHLIVEQWQKLEDKGSPVTSLAWSSDSRRLAAAHASYVAIWRGPAAYTQFHGDDDHNEDEAYAPWNLPWVQERRLEDPEGKFKLVKFAAFTPDGRGLAAGGQMGPGGAAAVWDLETEGLARTWRLPSKIHALLCPAGCAAIGYVFEGGNSVQWLSRGCSRRELILEPAEVELGDSFVDLAGNARKKASGLQVVTQLRGGALSADGGLFAARGASSTAWWIDVFDLKQGTSSQRMLKLPHHQSPQDIAIYTPPAKTASRSPDHHAGASHVSRTTRGNYSVTREMADLEQKKKAAAGLAHHENAMLAAAVNDKLMVWDLETNEMLPGASDLNVGATCVSFSPSGAFIAAGCRGKRFRCKVAVIFTADLRAEGNKEVIPVNAPIPCPETTPRGSTDREFSVNTIAVAHAVAMQDFFIVAANAYYAGIYLFDQDQRRLERCRSLSMENIRAIAVSPYFGVGERKSFQFAALKADVSFNVWTFGASLKDGAHLFGESPPAHHSLMEQGLASHIADTARAASAATTSSAASQIASPSSMLIRYGPSHAKVTLVIATGPRLTVWTVIATGSSAIEFGRDNWCMLYDLHFTGAVLEFCFGPITSEDQRPQNVVVQCRRTNQSMSKANNISSPHLKPLQEGTYYRVFDLHEYSLAFWLEENGLEQILERFGIDAFLALARAMPGLIHQRCALRQHNSGERSMCNIFHWAARGKELLMKALLRYASSAKNGASPFHLDSLGYNAVDYALAREHFSIVDDILLAAINDTTLLSRLLPECHSALTRTVVHLLHHNIPSIAEFLDCACLRSPEELAPDVASIPTQAINAHVTSMRTSATIVPMLTKEVCAAIAPVGGEHHIKQPVDVRMLILRGALDLDRRLIRAFCRTCNVDVLASLTAKVVIRHKWRAYGRRIFLQQFLTHIVFLCIFCIWSYLHVQKVRPSRPFQGLFSSKEEESDSDSVGVFVIQMCGLALTLLAFYFSYLEVQQVRRPAIELLEKDDSDEKRSRVEWLFLLRKGIFQFIGIWNLIDLARLICVLNIVWTEHSFTNEVVSFTAFIMWVQVLRFVRGFHDTGALVELVIQVLKDTLPFSTVVMIQMAAFTHGFYCMLDSDGFIEVPVDEGDTSWEKLTPVVESFLFTYRLFLGETDVDVHERTWPVKFMWLFCTFLTCVVMLNLLVSIIGDTYNKVQDEEIIQRNRQLAKLVYEADTLRRINTKIEPPKGCYLFTALRKERPLIGYRTTDAGMDPTELRKSDRAIDKELRRQSHCRLVKLEESAQVVQGLDEKLQAVSSRLGVVEQALQSQTMEVRSVVRAEFDALRKDMALQNSVSSPSAAPRPASFREVQDLH